MYGLAPRGRFPHWRQLTTGHSSLVPENKEVQVVSTALNFEFLLACCVWKNKIKQKQLKRRNGMRRPNVGKLGNKSVTKRSKKSSHTVGLGLVFFPGEKEEKKKR